MAHVFQRIGDYITVIDYRNSNGLVNKLMGISIDKCYIPSVANVIGTDLKNYKIIRKGQFACSLMQVSRDQRIPIAMYTDETPAIMSPAYVMFEVDKTDEILPEYMELWFRRAEFDREASFYAVGGVRGSLDWEDFCNMELPVPSINEQRKIVHDYQVVTDRIALLRKINDNLETQAKNIYKSWFEDYRPFNGDRPSKWTETTIGELAKEVVCGKTPPTEDANNYGGNVPFITIPDMHGSVYTVKTERTLSEKGVSTQSNKTLPENSICVSCIATVGLVCLTAEPSQTNQQINSIICKEDISPFYVYLKMTTLTEHLKALGAGGSATLNVNKTLFSEIKILYPDRETVSAFHNIVNPMFSTIRINQLEIEKLTQIAMLIMTNLIRTKGA
jgi:type I restriction enzyme S subunit